MIKNDTISKFQSAALSYYRVVVELIINIPSFAFEENVNLVIVMIKTNLMKTSKMYFSDGDKKTLE